MDRLWEKNYDFWYHSVNFQRMTVQDMLHCSAAVAPDKVATDFFGTQITYYQLRLLSIKFAQALVKIGVKKGDRVCLQLPNSPQFAIAYFGTLMAGGIATLMNPLYTADEVNQLISITQPNAFITFDMILPNQRDVLKQSGVTVIVTKITDFIDGFPKGSAQELQLEKNWHYFSDLLDSIDEASVPKIDISPDDPAIIVFTGGTTGAPKGAVHSHYNVVGATISTMEVGKYFIDLMPAETRCNIGVMPFFHIAGHIQCFTWGIFRQTTMYLVPRFDINEFINLLARIPHKITYFFAVPTLLTALVNHPKAKELALDKKFGLILSGGASCPVPLINKMKDMGLFYIEAWGMTETCGIGISTPIFGIKKPGSIGIPMQESMIKIVDLEDGKTEVPMGKPGELIFKSPFIMQEYWNNKEETAHVLKDGWLYTGDVVTMDEDGFIYIVDRKKDMIIAGGYNVYPSEIDDVLLKHPKVDKAVTVGVPDTYRGETVKAFIVLKEGEVATEGEIIEYCKQHLAAYKVPKIIEFRKELPMSAVGKILRKVLREEEMKKVTK